MDCFGPRRIVLLEADAWKVASGMFSGANDISPVAAAFAVSTRP